MARDPICGMNVDEKNAEHRTEYQGNTYYFCSLDCKAQFDEDPEEYKVSKDDGTKQFGLGR